MDLWSQGGAQYSNDRVLVIFPPSASTWGHGSLESDAGKTASGHVDYSVGFEYRSSSLCKVLVTLWQFETEHI